MGGARAIKRPPAGKLPFFRAQNFLKKSLPNAAIPGIPRVRGETTGLFGLHNDIASRHFQRSSSRAGIGSGNVESCEPR